MTTRYCIGTSISMSESNTNVSAYTLCMLMKKNIYDFENQAKCKQKID